MLADKKTLLEEYQIELHIGNYAQVTYKLYYDLAKDFLAWLPSLHKVDRDLVETYLLRFKDQAPSSRNQKASSMRRLLRFLKSQGYVKTQIRIYDVKVGRKLPDVLSEEEMAKVLKRMEGMALKWKDKRNYALVMFLYATGARISEAINIRWTDIEDEWIRINSGKGNKDRYVPIHQRAIEALEAYKEACPFDLMRDKPMFVNQQGKQLTRITAYKILKDNVGVNPHAIRHSFATHLIQNGCDIIIVADFLGHSSLHTTQIYTHIGSKHLQTTVNNCHPMSEEIIYA